MQSEMLYNKSKDGTINTWRVWTKNGTIYSEHGQQGGKKIISKKLVTPKNVGKANATTKEEQADLEAEAMFTHKLERKYRLSIKELEERMFLPMLAKKFEERKDKITYPVNVQIKYNGLRCLARWEGANVVLVSRAGKYFKLPHITRELEKTLPKDSELDGEVYLHGTDLTEINSYVKKYKPGLTEKLQYLVYDYPTYKGDSNLPWDHRADSLHIFFHDNKIHLVKNVVQAPLFVANSEEEVYKYLQQFRAEGYEGAIVRLFSGVYQWGLKRSGDLLKVKTCFDEEFVVTGFKAGGANKDQVVWTCVAPNGTEFDVFPKGTFEQKRQWLKDAKKYIGKKLTVEFREWTPYGVPFHGVGIVFRLKEDLS